MASVFVRIDDFALQQALGEAARQVQDLTPAMQDIGEYLLFSTRKRFDSESDPEGKPWTPLSPAYVAQKAKKKNALQGILTLTGIMRDTITYQAGARAVRVGSNRIYAPIQQLGGQTGKGGNARIPARPFLGLNDADRAEIVAILGDHLG